MFRPGGEIPLEDHVASLLYDIRLLPDSGMAVDRRWGNLDPNTTVEFYTRVGTEDAEDPDFRRETNRRILLGQTTPDGNYRVVQFIVYPNGVTKLLNAPDEWEWIENILGINLKNFPRVSEG